MVRTGQLHLWLRQLLGLQFHGGGAWGLTVPERGRERTEESRSCPMLLILQINLAMVASLRGLRMRRAWQKGHCHLHNGLGNP